MTTELTNASKLREFDEELKKIKSSNSQTLYKFVFCRIKAEEGKIFYGLRQLKMLVLKRFQIL